MKIEKFVIGIVSTNCYLVENEETKECFIVDPAACPTELVSHLKKQGLKPVGIILTHGHFDHILGIDGFLKEFPVPVYAHGEEENLLNDPSLNASAVYGAGYTFSDAQYLRDGQRIALAHLDIEVRHTPGHTPGGCCYYMPEEGVLFSGDTLFFGTVGRTDLPLGDSDLLMASIREKLMGLPEETKVYPGHSGETTIGYEKIHNSFL